ncbi:EamA family transporter [Rosenbergiella australiborealis]|uniref:EamA family transporter n=1 Tax=Rosenbergiella australiborealis TaxID=1544696 RepID=A0ABS5T7J7_9GAMM|nr:EamA family transporter [Rosenbergiella australiborealis]
MWYMLAVTLLWGSSFSLTGHILAGHVDGFFSVFIRTLIAAIVFVPMMKWRGLPTRLIVGLWVCGALQFGITYALAYQSFRLLTVPEMLLFTTLTPLYIGLINNALDRQWNPWTLLAALFAVSGGMVIHYHGLTGDFWRGFWILQLANATFAAGQVICRRLLLSRRPDLTMPKLLGHFFLGAVIISAILFALFGNTAQLPHTSLQWGLLVYLGLIATALGSLWLAKGSTQVSVTALAIFNELHVPIGLVINLLFWGSDVPVIRLLAGCALIAVAVAINYYGAAKLRAQAL